MIHAPVRAKLVTPTSVLLLLVTLAGGAAILYRMFHGLGAVTNMSDDLPWGLWKALNVIVVIALGAGGFTSAALIYVFCGERYHAFARSGVLLALLCYASAGFSLMFDIGIPWRIVHPIWMWPEHSILFEIAWCVMLYLSVLLLELLPAVFERFNWRELARVWRGLVPHYTVVALAFFTYIMTHTWSWTLAAFVLFAALAYILPRIVSRPATTPILLVMFGIILSTCHQSSLGSLFLLMPDKLSHLWWTPLLPVNFLLSAIGVGLCMIVIERILSAKAFGRKIQIDKLARIGGMAAVALWIYLIVRFVDLGARGNLADIAAGGKGAIFAVEMLLTILATLLLSIPKVRQSPNTLVFACVLLAAGIVANRLNVAIWGMTIGGVPTYVPSFFEILISASVFTGILLVYTLVVKLFPIFTQPHGEPAGVPVQVEAR